MKIAALLALTVVLVACAPLQDTARNGIASAKGFLDSEKAAHPECAVDSEAQACYLIKRGVAAKDATIDALEAYCGGSAFDAGAPCTPHSDLTDKLKSALANLNLTISDIKKVGK